MHIDTVSRNGECRLNKQIENEYAKGTASRDGYIAFCHVIQFFFYLLL